MDRLMANRKETFNMTVDRFQIIPFFRVMLIIGSLLPLALVFIVIWMVSSPYMKFSEFGPLILLGLIGLTVWRVAKMVRWYNFHVELSEQGIKISETELAWQDIASVSVRNALQFDTFIEIGSKEGRAFKIPACIQQNAFVLAKIEKHFPNIKKEN
jgi:hypothetical protein